MEAQPYLNFNEQRTLKEIINKIPSMSLFISSIILYDSKIRGFY